MVINIKSGVVNKNISIWLKSFAVFVAITCAGNSILSHFEDFELALELNEKEIEFEIDEEEFSEEKLSLNLKSDLSAGDWSSPNGEIGLLYLRKQIGSKFMHPIPKYALYQSFVLGFC